MLLVWRHVGCLKIVRFIAMLLYDKNFARKKKIIWINTGLDTRKRDDSSWLIWNVYV